MQQSARASPTFAHQKTEKQTQLGNSPGRKQSNVASSSRAEAWSSLARSSFVPA